MILSVSSRWSILRMQWPSSCIATHLYWVLEMVLLIIISFSPLPVPQVPRVPAGRSSNLMMRLSMRLVLSGTPRSMASWMN